MGTTHFAYEIAQCRIMKSRAKRNEVATGMQSLLTAECVWSRQLAFAWLLVMSSLFACFCCLAILAAIRPELVASVFGSHSEARSLPQGLPMPQGPASFHGQQRVPREALQTLSFASLIGVNQAKRPAMAEAIIDCP